MAVRKAASRSLFILAMIVLSAGVLAPAAVAQDTIPISVSLPSQWQDVLTPELLAEFESQYSGVKVYTVFSGNSFGRFDVTGMTVDQRLQDTEELVTSADVLYISSNTLTQEATQAGYFLDLSPLVMSDPAFDVNDFIPAVWQSFQWDNGIWALPISTDVILVTYDPAVFDAAGLVYPNEQWTINDFAYAASQLTQYNSDGTVATAGMMVNAASNSVELFLRSLLSAGVYDPTTMPNAPLFTSPEIEPLLTTWYDMIDEGILTSQGFGDSDVPLRVEGLNGYSARPMRGNDDNTETTRYAALLPGGVAGLSAQGFAVSAGSQYPELAYALANFLTTRSELMTNNMSASPARYSLIEIQSNNSTGDEQPGGGPGGGPGGMGGFMNIPEEIQPVVDQGLNAGLPISEIRYISYLTAAINTMQTNGGDVVTARQDAEVLAISDMQTATALRGTLSLIVAAPVTEIVLPAGKIALTCGVNQGFGGGMRGGQLPNQNEWDQVVADFIASDSVVGAVNLEMTDESDLATLAEQYDCFILSTNAVPGGDLSAILSLDPLLQVDPTFDPNDLMSSVLTQVQANNQTWALPLSFQVQMLEYDSQQFALAGVPEPVNGWTVDSFTDALRMLKTYDPESTPFVANDPSGAYMMLLIGAFGGLPLDYRTDPPTVNFTDAATVDAIRQVLDLAVDGYISYTGLVGGFGEVSDDSSETPAITTTMTRQFNFGPPGRPGESDDSTQVSITYPQGNTYNVLSVELTTAYISAYTQNADAAYRFVSQVSRSPQLFTGMPARRSLISSPEVIASQGENAVELFQQIETQMSSPNMVLFPTFSEGRGQLATTMMSNYWLAQVFDSYVADGADLETELADAEMMTREFQTCSESIVADSTTDVQEQRGQLMQQIMQCATTVDPDFSMGG